MPPKPFKPPRPAASTTKKSTSTSAKKTASKFNGTPKSKTNGIMKGKPGRKPKAGKDKDAGRISASSRLSFAGLPSLSPDSDDEREANSASTPRTRSHIRSAKDDSDSSQIFSDEEDEDVPSSPIAAPPAKRKYTKRGSTTKPLPELSPEPEPEPDSIPLDLLNVLLHQFYKDPNTRMSKDANKAVGRYMETFVREALARVAYKKGGGEMGIMARGDVLEVEDLEVAGPQLLLDF